MAIVRAAMPEGTKPINDLVVVASGSGKVVYARLSGTLSRDLSAALGEAAESGDADAVKRALVDPVQGGN